MSIGIKTLEYYISHIQEYFLNFKNDHTKELDKTKHEIISKVKEKQNQINVEKFWTTIKVKFGNILWIQGMMMQKKLIEKR